MTEGKIEIITKPHTDLWQRAYYYFRNDNTPVLQVTTDEKYFSFIAKTEFESKHRFDQCGVVMYLDRKSWPKCSIEYENKRFQHLGRPRGKISKKDGSISLLETEIPGDNISP